MIKEKYTCPNCKRRIRYANASHYCKEVAIDDLFVNKPDEIVLIFDTILNHVAAWDDVEISATKNCIVFVRNKTFLVVRPMSKCLEVKFYVKEMIDDEALYKCQVWNSKYQGIVRFKSEEAVNTKFLNYFKSAYLIS